MRDPEAETRAKEQAWREGVEAGRRFAVWLDTLSPDERVHVWAKEYRRIRAALRNSPAVQARLAERFLSASQEEQRAGGGER